MQKEQSNMIDKIKNKKLGAITNWKIMKSPRVGCEGLFCLEGDLVNHHTLITKPNEGYNNVITSEILWIDFELKLAETKNTIYQLV